MQSRLLPACLPNSLSGGTIASSFESLFLGCNAGRTFFHFAKNGPRSTTRSFETGRVGNGSIVIVGAPRVSTRVWQASLGIQLIRIAHVPHMPTRHEQRNESDGSCSR